MSHRTCSGTIKIVHRSAKAVSGAYNMRHSLCCDRSRKQRSIKGLAWEQSQSRSRHTSAANMSFSSWPVFHPAQPYSADQQGEAYSAVPPCPYVHASAPQFFPDPDFWSQPLDASLNTADLQPASQADGSRLERIEETLHGIQKEYVRKRSPSSCSPNSSQVDGTEQVRCHPLSMQASNRFVEDS